MATEEEKPHGGVGKALRAMGVGALGLGAGFGAAEVLGRNLKFFKEAPTQGRLNAARIILPILSGASVMLADRYRQRMNEEYKGVKGYQG